MTSRKSQAKVDCGVRFSRMRKIATLSVYRPTTIARASGQDRCQEF
jgi:hypothetical protein